METAPKIIRSPEAVVDFESIRRLAIEILYSHATPENFIDSGGAAKVYELPGRFCVKILEPRHNSSNRDKFQLGNPPLVEARLQERMSRTNYKGKTRVPHFFSVINNPTTNGYSAIVMERLNAINLQHILANPTLWPNNLNVDSFFADLENFLRHMHENERIAHGDLYPRNVMADLETGEPYLIDFGKSSAFSNLTEARVEKAYDEDWKLLDEMYESMYAAEKQLPLQNN